MYLIQIDRESPLSITRQIYLGLREAILDGRLASGTRLASSRELAAQLAVSRNVVLEAYDLLCAEGFVLTRHGSGTYVADGAVYRQPVAIQTPRAKKISMGYDADRTVINFKAGTPDLASFPSKLWLRHIREVLAQPLTEILAYDHPEGRRELREAICRYVLVHREIRCHPEQIIITAGTTQAIGIACSILLDGEKKSVVLEDPITHDIQEITKNYGSVPCPVPVDNDGIRTDMLPQEEFPAFVYVTPSHQFPIGGTLPIQRRIELLDYARGKRCVIIEDDYDSEFRFGGPPLSSLHSLAPERVVYIGTFSKTFCPAIRIGYLILPAALINSGRSRKWQSDLHNEVISQLALARFIEQGDYLRHLARMRIRYRQRRQILVDALTERFGERVAILGSSTGLHLVVHFRDRVFSQRFLKSVEDLGAKYYGVWIHSADRTMHRDKLLIGYGHLEPEKIREGIAILARACAKPTP